jgi:hypothetical protein
VLTNPVITFPASPTRGCRPSPPIPIAFEAQLVQTRPLGNVG